MRNPITINLSLSKQRGYSLIELMIAIPLGLLVMFAILQIFTASIQGVSMENAFSRVQENGRMSVELITRDIRAADYWGCIHDTSSIANNESLTSTVVPTDEQGISGENDVTSTTIGSMTVEPGTDTLTLRGSIGFSNARIESAMASDADGVSFSSGSGITSGDLLLIADCENADIFSSTTTASTSTGSTDSISHAKDFSDSYGIDAQLFAPYVSSYFIAVNDDDGYSLYRSEDGDAASELVRGVSDLQLTYGEDTDSDGYADTYANADGVSDMDNVMAVRMTLTSVSGNGVSGTSLTRDYTVTTSIRNRTLQ